MSGPRALVIEDNRLLRRALRIALEGGGFEVSDAGDGTDAIARLREAQPDVIFQDLGLPDVDGVELLDRIRAQPGGAEIPVIALSGLESSLERARRAPGSFADCLIKPVDVDTLLEAAARYAPIAVAGPEPASRASGIRVLVVDDDPVQRKLLRVRLEREGYSVDQAESSDAALAEVASRRPDAIVSDVLMPGLDGFGLVRRLRDDPRSAELPVVLASAFFVEEEDRELAAASGASDLVAKTPQMDAVVAALRAALDAPVPVATEGAERLARRHFDRVLRQLARQEQLNRRLGKTVALQSAQLTVLAGVAGALRRTFDLERTLTEALERSREIDGIEGGAAFGSTASGRAPDLLGHSGLDGPKIALRLLELAAAQPGWGSDGLAILGSSELAGETGASVVRSLVALRMEAGSDPVGALLIGLSGDSPNEDQLAFARTVASQVAETIALASSWSRLADARRETIMRLARAAEFRDEGTARHTERVGSFARLLAEQTGADAEICELIELAATMHDAGKVGVPDAVLLKPGPLTPAELEVMRRHPEYGHSILSGSDDETLNLAATIALTHHERWDGSGYPRGVVGPEIPVAGRITAVADVFDAVTSDRPYRGAMTVESAVGLIEAGRGSHFDPDLVDAFRDCVDRFAEIKAGLPDPA